MEDTDIVLWFKESYGLCNEIQKGAITRPGTRNIRKIWSFELQRQHDFKKIII